MLRKAALIALYPVRMYAEITRGIDVARVFAQQIRALEDEAE